jgi:hypothetical protein
MRLPEIIKKHYGGITLLVLAVLLIIKLLIDKCVLWLCLSFVFTVVSYFIISDFYSKSEK